MSQNAREESDHRSTVFAGTFLSTRLRKASTFTRFESFCVGVVSVCVWLVAGMLVAASIEGRWTGVLWSTAFVGSIGLMIGTIFMLGKQRERKRKRPDVAAICQRLADRTSRHEFGQLPPGTVRLWLTEDGIYDSTGTLTRFTGFKSFSIESPREHFWRVVFWAGDEERASKRRFWMISGPLLVIPCAVWVVGLESAISRHGLKIDSVALALLGVGYGALIAMFCSKGMIQRRTSTVSGRVARVAGLFRCDAYEIDDLAGFLKRYLQAEDSANENVAQPTP
jgi:hypothetical protein